MFQFAAKEAPIPKGKNQKTLQLQLVIYYLPNFRAQRVYAYILIDTKGHTTKT
jgi:hypothetical protein